MRFREFEYQLQIKEHHLDTFGHVNNAVYLELFEEARWEMITEGKYDLQEIKATKQGPVILEVNVQFKRELVNREYVKIISKGTKVEGKIMYLEQKMFKSDGSLACQAVFTLGFMDLKSRKLIFPPIAWENAIGLEKVEGQG
ncbi:acyl-CoA thioesterase [Xanthovirga aplysinae]|uniref:acyl-CoA thioesterase n=1 Tax=Xanthovirga aplysinae TaxID=2529853 RepID=UPI0012BBAEED|nr:acyl-CoA thioesterase [Xanthovirga aplysinae]MTI31615.1 acyl-CoA thioesterase [Xanthovirga aplysinae]